MAGAALVAWIDELEVEEGDPVTDIVELGDATSVAR